jgi:hypothetical protein
MTRALNPEDLLIRGWNVIPVRVDKRPVFPWKKYQRQLVSVAELLEWHRKLRPTGSAVITGSISKVIVLDFDGDEGAATLQGLGFAPHVRTGSGGSHYYVEHPGFRVPTVSSRVKLELAKVYPGLDIRGDGGYDFVGVLPSPIHIHAVLTLSGAPELCGRRIVKKPPENRNCQTFKLLPVSWRKKRLRYTSHHFSSCRELAAVEHANL